MKKDKLIAATDYSAQQAKIAAELIQTEKCRHSNNYKRRLRLHVKT